VRLVLDVTASPIRRRDGSGALPPASVVGTRRVPLPLVGSGSARVVSAPLTPKVIDGLRYVVVDMGEPGQLPLVRRPGLTDLWAKSVPIDPRFLTSYVRDISLVSDSAYQHLRAPHALTRFPADLHNPGLEYSGIYEDGWLSDDAYALLAGGPRTRLVAKVEVPGGYPARTLRILLDGHTIAERKVGPGNTTVTVPIAASPARRRVEFRWSRPIKLPAPDGRSVGGLLVRLGVR
jgi:hypothetical protein